MPRDEEITFADHMGRHYAHRYAFPPMAGRVLGYLLVCDPPDPTIAELSDAVLASRSAVTGAAGERMDRVRVDLSSAQSRGFDVTEYQELADLAREGLEVIKDAPPERRATLMEMEAFADWLVERTRILQEEWEAHRDALRASGDLPGKA